jgi:hypothetical protein
MVGKYRNIYHDQWTLYVYLIMNYVIKRNIYSAAQVTNRFMSIWVCMENSDRITSISIIHVVNTSEIHSKICSYSLRIGSHICIHTYEGVSKSFRTESITKWTTTINTHWEATQRVMAAKLTRLTHKIAIQLHLVAESSTICSSRSRRPVRKLLGTQCWRLHVTQKP